MSDYSSHAVPVGAFVYLDVDHIKMYGIYQYSSELESMCVHSYFTDIEYPVKDARCLTLISWNDLDSVPECEVVSYARKMLMKV